MNQTMNDFLSLSKTFLCKYLLTFTCFVEPTESLTKTAYDVAYTLSKNIDDNSAETRSNPFFFFLTVSTGVYLLDSMLPVYPQQVFLATDDNDSIAS